MLKKKKISVFLSAISFFCILWLYTSFAQENSPEMTVSGSKTSSQGICFITVIQGENGTITPKGDQDGFVTVSIGDDQTFTITPEPNCQIATLLIDGSPVAVASTYTFTNVTEDHTIKATFDNSSDIQNTIRIPEVFSLNSAKNMITYSIPTDAKCNVTVSVYTVSGQLVKSVAHDNTAAGIFSIDLKSGTHRLGNGMYICTLKSSKFSQTVKVSVK